MKKLSTKLLVVVLALVVAVGCVACKGNGVPDADLKEGTYRTVTSVMPSNWNELTYADNNDTQIMNYISSSFFEYDYEFDEDKGGKYNKDGTINTEAIVTGSFTTNYSAATGLEDVTSKVDKKWGYTDKQKSEGGYAWKITLRKDLKWDDGTAITADDFVYSMQEMLNPKFLNSRANTYYQTLKIKRSRAYYYKETEVIYSTVGSFGYKSNEDAIADGQTIYIDVYDFYDAQGYVDQDGNEISQWVAYDDETVYNSPKAWDDPDNEKIQDPFSGAMLWDYYFSAEGGAYASYVAVGASYESWLSIKEVNNDRDVTWDDVGLYKDGTYSIVVCLDKSYQFLKDDGTLSYLAAYYMSSLPLVKRDLYESCKKEPASGSTLYTSNYNSTLETTASWGPYKLETFQSGKFYRLVRNENWYGYGMTDYANQYNITAIECECVKEASTQWLKFFSGEVDDASLDSDHVADFLNSKYTTFAPDTGTYGMQLYGNLSVLKASGNNNTILAIDEFRQAFSLALNRDDLVEKIWPGTATVCLGLMNSMYYYDVLNGGVYRDTVQAKKALLRAYGFTEGEDGKWTNGAEIKNASLDDAYEAITGYNPTLAKQLLVEAYEKMVADPDTYGYDAEKKIKLVYGSSIDNAKQRERAQYLQDVLDNLAQGTVLEGKFEIVFDASAQSQWAEAFRSGNTQIGFGYGFSGNALNPFDIVGSFVDPDDQLNYHTYWDTTKVQMTLTMPEGDYEGAGQTITMDLRNWYACLNGLAEDLKCTYKYNWDAGIAPVEARLEILAALEEQTLTKAYSVMLIGEYAGSLLSPKFSYLSYDYNTFMGFGGIRYLVVNMTDAEWTEYVSQHNGNLETEYKKEA